MHRRLTVALAVAGAIASSTFVLPALAQMPSSPPAASTAESPAAPAPPATSAPASTSPGARGADAARDEAIARFNRGIELYNESDYPAARIELQKAYDLAPSFKILYNIGQVCFQLQDYVCALRSFRRYLGEGADQIPQDRRQSVTQDIQRLEPRIGRLDIVTNPPGADISIDDVYAGKTPLPEPLMVNVGRRKVTATMEGHLPVTREVDAAGASVGKVQIDLQAMTKATASRWTLLSWIGIGSGVALVAVGGVFGYLSLNAHNSVSNDKWVGTQPQGAVLTDQSTQKTDAMVSDILWISGAAVLATTLILTLTHTPKNPAGVSVAVGPTGAFLYGGF